MRRLLLGFVVVFAGCGSSGTARPIPDRSACDKGDFVSGKPSLVRPGDCWEDEVCLCTDNDCSYEKQPECYVYDAGNDAGSIDVIDVIDAVDGDATDDVPIDVDGGAAGDAGEGG
jgi:hypothetical protein